MFDLTKTNIDVKDDHLSPNYKFTVYERDSFYLRLLRSEIARDNEVLRKYGHTQKRVVVRGRRPNTGYDYSGNVIGGLESATEFDVYVYDRSRRSRRFR